MFEGKVPMSNIKKKYAVRHFKNKKNKNREFNLPHWIGLGRMAHHRTYEEPFLSDQKQDLMQVQGISRPSFYTKCYP